MNIRTETETPGLRELLAFYAEAGVDAALVDEPINHLAARSAVDPQEAVAQRPAAIEPERARPTAAAPAAPRNNQFQPGGTVAVPDEAQIALARQRAATAATLDELRDQMAAFDGCNLKFTAKNLVFADGNPEADIMLVGEAPGRDEDLEGLPFVGRSGQLLDRILAAIGLDRGSVYIANVIPWRPPGNRTPTPHETEICRPFIERQIELANPRVLVTLGGPSAKTLLNTTEGVMRLRGNWKTHVTSSGISIPAMPTLHPAYLLRNPAHKKFAWRDFLEIKVRLDQLREQAPLS
ncbi:MAG: uracil-DNA glycosylase [Rhizobiaceae bacterium]|nr:uracil-DNA glycosylase [Rhizobiaceae bacterium]